MTTNYNNNDVQPQKEAPTGAVQARRRFIRTGATGAVLTLASGSGMAAVCTLPSGNMSGAARARGAGGDLCIGGFSPGYWKKPDRIWPAGILRTTPFGDVFSSDEPYKSTTLGVMVTQQDSGNSFDTHNIGCHFVASYLNIAGRSVTFMNMDDLRRMWNELRAFSEYRPTPNADPWDAEMVKDYLVSTYHSNDGG